MKGKEELSLWIKSGNNSHKVETENKIMKIISRNALMVILLTRFYQETFYSLNSAECR